MFKKNIYFFNYICFINKNDFLQYIYFLIPTPSFLKCFINLTEMEIGKKWKMWGLIKTKKKFQIKLT
jgi:hypothetical protein